MKKHYKIIIILIIFLVLGISIYRSPDNPYWLKANLKDAIEIGRTYSYNLLNGNKKELLKTSVSPAKENIKNQDFYNIRDIGLEKIYAQIEEQKIPDYLTWPFTLEQKNEDMELIMLEKLNNSFIVMTFAYKNCDTIVQIPGKGIIFFSIAIRYYHPMDDRLIPKLGRKIANLPLVRNLSGHLGTTARWVVFDYSYKYNLNDYFNWVMKEWKNYTQEHKQSQEEIAKQILKYLEKSDELTEKWLASDYEWGAKTIKEQIDRIEKMYKNEQESN